MKSNLEQALIACSYRFINSKSLYMKLYGFNWIIFDINKKLVSSWFPGKENNFVCWNTKEFDEIFSEDCNNILEFAKSVQYYEKYNGPHGHGDILTNIKNYMLLDNYFNQSIFL